MKLRYSSNQFRAVRFEWALLILCGGIMLTVSQPVLAQTPSAAESQATATPAPPAEAPKIPNDQLDALVAPIEIGRAHV